MEVPAQVYPLGRITELILATFDALPAKSVRPSRFIEQYLLQFTTLPLGEVWFHPIPGIAEKGAALQIAA